MRKRKEVSQKTQGGEKLAGTWRRRHVYRSISCSSSWILARLETFFGFGFGGCGGGFVSFYAAIKMLALLGDSFSIKTYPAEPVRHF